MSRRLLRAWVDGHIGWHQGCAERAEETARRHRTAETRWRAEYERQWPNSFRRTPAGETS